MSRSTFFAARRSARDDSSAEALLHQYQPSSPQQSQIPALQLQDLSPQPSLSSSPPPSFYRSQNAAKFTANPIDIHARLGTTNDSLSDFSPTRTHSTTGISPERSRSRAKGNGLGPVREVQFKAPPPPIVQSVVFRQPAREDGKGRERKENHGNKMDGSWMGSPRRAGGMDPLVGLERRERAIQKELQSLLDAQSAGLIEGFGGQLDTGEGSEAGSSTPTSHSVLKDGSRSREQSEKRGVTPVRQPKKKALGLRGARRGLLRDMGELVGIKTEEGEILELEIKGREEALKKVDSWEGRIEGFAKNLRDKVTDSEESREIEELNNEEKAVDMEIREMEDRLLQMRSRKKWLRERISESVNRRESGLSSYRGALREVESEVKEFLKRPPLRISPVSGSEEEGFMALPPHRRTLGMAREFFTQEVSSLHTLKQDIEKEKLALEEGAKLWRESVALVMEFEDDLRSQMKSGAAGDGQVLRKQVDKMGVVIKKLEEALRKAEDEGWNLLICCLGAEKEAFKEGEGILRGALGTVDVNGRDEGVDQDKDTENEEVGQGLMAELRQIDSVERETADSSEDDVPAELLVDHGES